MSFGALLVTGADGTQREIALDSTTALVGRSAANSIVLDEISIARRHARITVDSGRLFVEDLGSATGTFINEERVEPHVPSLVKPGDALRFGEVVAYFTDAIAAVEEPSSEGGAIVSPEFASTVRVLLTAPAAAIVPGGEPVTAMMAVTNTGNVVDEITFEIRGLAAPWVHMSQASVVLLPGDTREVGFAIRIPREPEASAGVHEISVVATSQQTGREALAAGSIQVSEFEDTGVEIGPRRARKNFKVLLANRGNSLVAYQLAGSDEEEAFRYRFDETDISLVPGETREIKLRIKRPRRWVGHTHTAPFKVIATPQHRSGEAPQGEAQLQIRPVFGSANFSPATIMLVLLVVGIGAYFFWPRDDGIGPRSAEAAFDGVHLCDKSSEEQEAAATATEASEANQPGEPGFQGAVSGGPFYAQNDPQWADVEYARAKDPTFGPDWCGSTIAQCGCAMTSVATVLALYSLVEMPDGADLSPETLNAWFNGNARLTERGWVSQGYIYGDVIWTAANQLSAEMHAMDPKFPTIRFVRTGSGSEAEIRSELEAGRPIILEVPGHWIAAVGIEEETGRILINDPFYRDRTHLDTAYPDLVKSSVLFEPSDDLSAVVFTAPSDVRMRITDKQGRVVGTLNTGAAEDAESGAVIGIPGASYSSRQAWRDPTCIMSPPPEDAGTNQIILPGGADDYTLEIIDTAGKPASVAVHTYGQNGETGISTIETDKPAVAEVAIAEDGSGAKVTVQEGRRPTPEPEVTAQNQEEETPGSATASVSPTASAPTPTPTPPPLETALQLPAEAGQERLETASNEGFFVGDTIVIDPGTAIEETNTITGFGSFILASPLRFSHSAGAVIVRIRQAPPNPDGSAPQGPPEGESPPLLPPDNVGVGCSTLYNSNPKRATVICGATIEGEFTTIRWTSNGTIISEAANKESLFLSFTEDTSTTIVLTVCNITICRSTSALEAIRFPVVAAAAGARGGTGAGPGQPVPPPPPTRGIVVSCATGFDSLSGVAVVNCIAVFPDGTPYTSITWSAPGGTPPGKTSQSDTFTTTVPNPDTALRITATLCNFSDCETSEVYELSFGSTVVELATFPSGTGDYPQFQEITLTATVRGPSPPVGGQVIFMSGTTELGPAALIPAGDFGFASLTVTPNNDPQQRIGIDLGPRSLTAHYTGGATLFPGTSDAVNINIVMGNPDDCDSVDNDNDLSLDEDCEHDVNPKSVGGGTVVNDLTIAVGTGLPIGSSAVAAPGEILTSYATVNRTAYCPGCIRQVYMALAENPTANSPATVPAQGPVCLLSAVLSSDRVIFNQFTAPDFPGVYYIRLTGSLQYSCVVVGVGSPATSAGRVVVQSDTATAVTSSISSNAFGSTSPVTFTATVSRLQGAAGIPEGRVAFTGISGMSCTIAGSAGVPANNNVPIDLEEGSASLAIDCDTSGLAAGPYSVGAAFTGRQQVDAGNPNSGKFYADSTAPSIPFNINYPAPQLTATGNPLSPSSVTANPASAVNLQITGSNFFSGVTTVEFDPDGPGGVGATPLTSSSITNTQIQATIPTALLTTANTATVTVRNPSPGGGSASANFTINNPVPGAGSLSPTNTNVAGTAFTLTVNGSNFISGRSTVRWGANNGSANRTTTFVSSSQLTAQILATDIDTAGSFNVYVHTTGPGGGDAGPLTFTVNKAATSTGLSITGNPAALGGTLTFTATVSSGTSAGSISGTVNFCVAGTGPNCSGGNLLGTDTSISGGQAQITRNNIGAGSYNATAHYLGNTNYAASSAASTGYSVNKANVTVNLTANPTTGPYGTLVTLTADVNDTVSGFTPTGTVTFRHSPSDSTCSAGTLLGTDTIDGSATGETTSTVIPAGLPANAICVRYEGDTNFNADADTATVTITANTTTTSITQPSAGAKNFGETITFSANVTSAVNPPPGSGDGQVQFLYNTGGTDVLIATASKTGSSWTTSTTTLGVGSYNVFAKFVPTAGEYSQSQSTTVAITVNASSTTTTMTSPANASSHTWGANITWTATVSPTTANGTVTFYQAGGAVPIAITTATVSGGTASTIAPAPASMPASGTAYTVFAAFSPSNTNFASSQSLNRTVTITPAATSTSLSASPNPVVVGSATTLTATVTSSVAGTITGTVNFCVDGTGPNCTGGNLLGTDTTIVAGVASIGWTPTSAGAPVVRAYYLGAGNYGASSGAVTVTVNNPVPTISDVNPGTVASPGAATVISIDGTGFAAGATVSFDADGAGTGATPQTLSGAVVVSATQITVTVPANLLTTAGTAHILVTNPTPGGGTSGTFDFVIT